MITRLRDEAILVFEQFLGLKRLITLVPNILTLIGLRSKAQLVSAVFDWARTDLYSASSFRDEEYWGVMGRGGEWGEDGGGGARFE